MFFVYVKDGARVGGWCVVGGEGERGVWAGRMRVWVRDVCVWPDNGREVQRKENIACGQGVRQGSNLDAGDRGGGYPSLLARYANLATA